MEGEQTQARSVSQEVKAKGLVGDDRWFYMEDCMDKT
jgi:hypothetical protein